LNMVEQEAEIESDSLGEQLRECREKKQIGITEIAAQMHLDARIIRAIEDDNYDALPDPIYVRGYIRSYCKLLGLNADEYLEIFRKNVNRGDPEIIPEVKYPSQTSSSDKPVKLFTYLISLGLVLLVIAWWQSNFIITNQAGVDTNSAGENSLLIPEPLIDDLTIDDPGMSTDSQLEVPGNISFERLDENLGMNILDDYDNTGAASMDEDEITQDMDTLTSGQEGGTTTLTNGLAGQEQETLSARSAEEPGQTVSPPSVGPDSLVLNITADSWIEIFDVNEQKIYFDLGRTGERLALKGTAPFDILLGFAQGVTIEFNGKSVDQAPYTRSGVARFSLGE
jgi:cytoskeleton protein RodZ